MHWLSRMVLGIMLAAFGTPVVMRDGVRADDAAQDPLMYEDGSERWPTIVVNGITRKYIFNIPAKVKAAGKPAPMIVMLHGAGQGADRLRAGTTMEYLSEQYGFVVVYPQGQKAAWNDGRPDEVKLQRKRSSADDVAFLNDLVDRFIADGIADPDRVYLAGFSNGGFLAIDIACTAGHRFAAIGTAISGAAAAQLETCDAKSFVPLIMINGTKDTFVPWDGAGEGKARMLGITEIFESFAKRGGCTAKKEETPADRYPGDGVTTTIITAPSCANGGEVALYRMNEGGHQLPSHRTTTNERLRAAMFGLRSIDIDTSAVLWDFFKRFRRS